jgi:serine/threonine protein kinase
MQPPMNLLQLSNLRWVGLSNNPFLQGRKHDDAELAFIDDPMLDDTKWPILGQGAGGVTRQVNWGDLPVAVKTFAGSLTSDGSPQDERAISVKAAVLKDPSLIQLLGQTKNGALVMEFLKGYEALAGPPSLETCSRDTYPINQKLSEHFAWRIALRLLRVLLKLHQNGICHGDFYGHNILVSSSEVKLSDFGAAFFYDPSTSYGRCIHQIELRSYCVLVEELQKLVSDNPPKQPWDELAKACQSPGATFGRLVESFHLEE